MRVEDEYAAFYRAEFPHVVRTSYLIVHDRQRAEEIAQEAFIQLLIHWGKVSRYEQPGAWVRRVAIRIAYEIRPTRASAGWRSSKKRSLPPDISRPRPRSAQRDQETAGAAAGGGRVVLLRGSAAARGRRHPWMLTCSCQGARLQRPPTTRRSAQGGGLGCRTTLGCAKSSNGRCLRSRAIPSPAWTKPASEGIADSCSEGHRPRSRSRRPSRSSPSQLLVSSTSPIRAVTNRRRPRRRYLTFHPSR